MILYVIQAHADAEQIIQLARHLADGYNYCVINLDPARTELKAELDEALRLKPLLNTITRSGSPINWGGISQVHALIDVMNFAVSWPVPWQFLINLSADSMPLVSQTQIRDFYLAGLRDGKRIYLSFFGAGFNLARLVTVSTLSDLVTPPPIETASFCRRIPATIDAGLKNVLAERDTNPVFRARLRGSVHVTDAMLQKKLIIRRLTEMEAAYRAEIWKKRLLYAGRCWCTIERSAVERILLDRLTTEILHDLEHFLCPDELFLQSYAMNSSRFKLHEIVRANQRYQNGDRVMISDALEEDLFSCGAFFARKVRLRQCPRLRARVQSL